MSRYPSGDSDRRRLDYLERHLTGSVQLSVYPSAGLIIISKSQLDAFETLRDAIDAAWWKEENPQEDA